MLKVSIVLPSQFGYTEMKARIQSAAHELFMKYGIRTISMDDIAKHLSISKKTIYQSYKDKDELVHELMTIKLKEDSKRFQDLGKESENVIDEVFNMMKHMGKVIGQVNPSFFYDLQKYHPESWKLFKGFKENFILKMVEETLVRGIKQGLIRPEVNVKIISRMRMEQIDMGFNPAIFPPDKFQIIDVQLSMIDHFLYGICTLKGHKLINKYKQIIDEE
jgi:AcrR family transcriptional regulator